LRSQNTKAPCRNAWGFFFAYPNFDKDLNKSENISPSFVSRILRLAYLSPTVVEAILDGKYPAQLTMKDLMEPFPMEWDAQAKHFEIECD